MHKICPDFRKTLINNYVEDVTHSETITKRNQHLLVTLYSILYMSVVLITNNVHFTFKGLSIRDHVA